MSKNHVLIIELPADERGISPSQVARYDKAKRALDNPLTKAKAREGHLNTISRIEAAPKEATDKAWIEGAKTESIDLARSRGEDVETTKAGHVRIRSRDGLHNLYVNRQLTQEEYDQASAWRKCFEARSGDVGSQMGAESSGGAHDNHQFVANRYLRATMTNALAKAQRRIAVDCTREPATLQMFNAIVGDGNCLTSFGRGRAYDRHLAALKWSLEVAETSRKER